ncbi:hypothetical protein Kfla_6368 [Kribbella flavida DSM 17836]|uniref:Uncharacterized protein n=1 Tax=Kribbella flavida (strain DSM 17836 / JCM 10339 / NBRC 14399) TaxID=479435 RepID=D2PWY9_KRIFD|nr:hypothetical protein [Kribbella flavida]ADB35369.1 hypothetical protein Kfla_6368 [Kribbella flavida DSM 17836]
MNEQVTGTPGWSGPEQDLRAARYHLEDVAAVLRQALAEDDALAGTPTSPTGSSGGGELR